jgi:peptidyl-dipeptidase Dcp
MRLFPFLFIILLLNTMACKQNPLENEIDNPLLTDWSTPFHTPPFDEIEEDHYMPAFEKAITGHEKEIQTIATQKEAPTFENTIVALDQSGELLNRVRNVFNSMNSAMTNDSLQEIAKIIYPLLSNHNDQLTLNERLFTRIQSLYDKKDQLDLNKEQQMLLDHYYRKFVRGGALLSNEDKERFQSINEQLSVLSVQFGENVLKETNKFELVLSPGEELAGLPESVLAMGADEAKNRGYEGKYVYTIQRTSMYPFLTYSTRRDLREKLYKGYINRGDNNDELDNKGILAKMASLRVQKAKLLGYETHAHYVLEENMAKTPENVFSFLDQLWTPALEVAKNERQMMQEMIDAEGGDFELASWDWWYYAEKIRKEKYDLNEDAIRPYFEVSNVINGVFDLSTRLWGITFEERTDIPKYHPDVKTFEVKDSDGSHIAVLYTDYFPRASKRGGAWMDVFTKQHIRNGEFIHPVVYNVGNFSKPTGDKPALLSLDNVNTLFHEFGHALHGMLSECTYESLSGTSTPRDFVEFPSQVMENWCMHPEVLKNYAFQYETGEPIPEELIQKINNASKFNQGFATIEYLAASYLDMHWHTLTDTTQKEANAFETEVLAKIGLIPEIISRYRSTYFSHIFSGGYSAGYYSYIWSEVLDADAFRAFWDSGDVYNQDLATKLRYTILSQGGTRDALEMYKAFRGAEPGIEPLLAKRGLQ